MKRPLDSRYRRDGVRNDFYSTDAIDATSGRDCSTASAPIDGVSDSIGRRRRPLSFRAAILTSELVLEVPGRLAVAHHDDRGLLARALAQRALRGAEQHDATLWLLELRLLRALRCSKAQFWGKRA